MGANVDALVAGMIEFGTDVYAEVAEPDQNVVLSPLNMAVSVAMVRAGARGETADEIDHVARFLSDPVTTHASFNALASTLLTGS